MLVPVYTDPFAFDDLVDALRDHGIVVVNTIPSTAKRLAKHLRAAIGIPSEREDDDACLLHLACPVDPLEEHGWIDYFVYSAAFETSAMAARALVGDAVRQWAAAGEPGFYYARVAT
jgi:hypothetical protein